MPLGRETRLILLTALAAASACAETPAAGRGNVDEPDPPVTAEAIVVVDAAGRTVTLPAPARRVVSLIPSATEVIIALDAVDLMVARNDYDVHPAVAHLPSAGGGLTPSLEWLAALQPDLVLAWPDQASRALVQRLESLGIRVFTARPERVDDVFADLDAIGRLLGKEDAARDVATSIRHQLDSVRASAPPEPRPGVLYLVGVEPPRTVSAGTFLHELVELAGGRNVFEDVATGWPEVSLEAIVARAPDVIVIAQGVASSDIVAQLSTRPGWRDLAAVHAGRVYEVDANLYNRPGPNIGLVAAELADMLRAARAPAPATGSPR